MFPFTLRGVCIAGPTTFGMKSGGPSDVTPSAANAVVARSCIWAKLATLSGIGS